MSPHVLEVMRLNKRFARASPKDLQPVELVDLEYQIAQKLHAVTDLAYARAHDLVDLQLLWNVGPSLPYLHRLCARTFDWRNQQPWPPLPLRPMENWALAYDDAREETEVAGQTPVLPDVAAAREWLGQIIEIITEAEPED